MFEMAYEEGVSSWTVEQWLLGWFQAWSCDKEAKTVGNDLVALSLIDVFNNCVVTIEMQKLLFGKLLGLAIVNDSFEMSRQVFKHNSFQYNRAFRFYHRIVHVRLNFYVTIFTKGWVEKWVCNNKLNELLVFEIFCQKIVRWFYLYHINFL